MDYDIIVVGGGPAGLQASLTTSYLKLNVCVIELERAGGALANKYPWKHVDEFLGFRDKKGGEISKKLVEHVKSEGVTVKEREEVKDIKRVGDSIKVASSRGGYECKALVLAIGLGVPRKLDVPGEELDGVLYSMAEPMIYKGKKVLVVGGGDTAVEQACSLNKVGAQVTIAHRRDEFRASEKNVCTLQDCSIPCLFNTEVKEILGKDNVEAVKLVNNKTSEEITMEADDILLLLGTTSNKDFLDKNGVKTDKKGSVVVDENMKTNIEGVFAAGDVVGL